MTTVTDIQTPRTSSVAIELARLIEQDEVRIIERLPSGGWPTRPDPVSVQVTAMIVAALRAYAR